LAFFAKTKVAFYTAPWMPHDQGGELSQPHRSLLGTGAGYIGEVLFSPGIAVDPKSSESGVLGRTGEKGSGNVLVALEALECQVMIWRLAMGCWLVALAPVWLIALLQSRWAGRRAAEPIATLVRQCEEIRQGGAAARLRYAGNDARIGSLTAAVNELLNHFNYIAVRQHQFAADAAHELRTPLAALSVVGENALARRCSNAELREVVGSMLEESRHMQRLIENLLELTHASVASLADEKQAHDPQPLELAKLARGCVETLQILADEKRQRIELDPEVVWADADATMVRQALLNVIHNAIEHCPEGARIEVTTARFSLDQAMIRVTDDGFGIPREQQAHVFNRFYRGPNSIPRRGRGLGLGLAIAKTILESQRGDIHLRSEPAAGCCFTLVLPLLQDCSAQRGPYVISTAAFPAPIPKQIMTEFIRKTEAGT
jgi:two-component system, OmpR family, sensor kinase